MTQTYKPNYAFILAAGMGSRLKPYTDTMPKPMVPVNNRPILDYALDKLTYEQINNVTINLFYLGDRIKKHLEERHDLNITFSIEEELLDTGGGVKKALDTINEESFYLINGDALWTDKNDTALNRLANTWDPETMDVLLLLQPIKAMTLTKGVGDYDLKPDGKAVRSKNKSGAYMFGGIRIAKKDIFQKTPNNAFSFLELMDKAEKESRLHAIVHEGEWHHISTPDDLERVNTAIEENSSLQHSVKTA